MGAVKVRRKPVAMDAVHYDGSQASRDAVSAFCNPVDGPIVATFLRDGDPPGKGFLRTKEGKLAFEPGYWILKGADGAVWAVAPDDFDATYELEPVAAVSLTPVLEGGKPASKPITVEIMPPVMPAAALGVPFNSKVTVPREQRDANVTLPSGATVGAFEFVQLPEMVDRIQANLASDVPGEIIPPDLSIEQRKTLRDGDAVGNLTHVMNHAIGVDGRGDKVTVCVAFDQETGLTWGFMGDNSPLIPVKVVELESALVPERTDGKTWADAVNQKGF